MSNQEDIVSIETEVGAIATLTATETVDFNIKTKLIDYLNQIVLKLGAIK